MPEDLEKWYGAHKVSEFTHGKNYEMTDPHRPKTEGDEFFEDYVDDDADYSKRYTLETKKEAYKKEY